jgi:hypothetical protein
VAMRDHTAPSAPVTMPNAPMFETRAMGCEEVDARLLNRDLAEDTAMIWPVVQKIRQ